ncbi:hypothetical protein JCM10213_006549 [Rhodosporidiobolus nylandii]
MPYLFASTPVAHSHPAGTASHHASTSTSCASSSPSGSTSHKLSSAHTFPYPYPMARRGSYSSSVSSDDYFTDSSSEDELLTPQTSPEIKATHLNGKGKGVDLSASLHAFSLSGVVEDEDDALSIPVEWALPSSVVPLPAAPRSADVPSTPTPALAPEPQPQAAPRPSPASPTTAAAPTSATLSDEDQRGRSRWPRLLWRSEIDDDSLTVLKNYHERAVGGPLPQLRREMSHREVGRWSRRMEDAGL